MKPEEADGPRRRPVGAHRFCLGDSGCGAADRATVIRPPGGADGFGPRPALITAPNAKARASESAHQISNSSRTSIAVPPDVVALYDAQPALT
jgi:hypothetical protein